MEQQQISYEQQPNTTPQPYAQPVAPGFVDSIKLFFKQYATFKGRSRRREYWFVVLFTLGVSMVISLTGLSFLSSIVSVAFFIPSLALQCRRLHDIGRSGHWIWFDIIADILGYFIMMYAMILMLTSVPQLAEELEKTGMDTSLFYEFSDVADFPLYVIAVMAVYVIAVKINFLIFNCTDSQKGTNQYGPSTKYPDNPSTNS